MTSVMQSNRYSDFIDGSVSSLATTAHDSVSIYGGEVDQIHLSNPDATKEKKVTSLVDWDGPHDPANPQNWSNGRKGWITAVLALCTVTAAFGSSVLSSATATLAHDYNVSTTVALLNLALYVAGFAAGPWVWGPASEYLGRWWPFAIGYIGFMCFTVGVATAQNLYTILICRFLQGAWGIATNTVVPGILVDIWDQRTRPLMAIAWFMTVVTGPTMGPIVGSFTVKNESLGWRWTMWFTLIPSAAFFLLFLFSVPETWAPIILQKKASRLRYETKDWSIHSRRDENPVDAKALLKNYGLKPWQMLIQEPILAAITGYVCFTYGIIYLTFEALPYAFGTVRGWEEGVSSLPFLSLLVGYLASGIISGVHHIRVIDRKLANGQKPVPEDQLPVMILGSFILIAGFFWFAWTSSPHISWVPQVLACPLIGCGLNLVFIPCLTYLIECYLANANSALAANTVLRSAVAAGFPLFSGPMYRKLGVAWATSLLGFLVVAFLPAPIILYVYGRKIRSWSKYAFALDQ